MKKQAKVTGKDYKLALRAANRVFIEIRTGLRSGEGAGPVYSANVAYAHRWIGICFTRDDRMAPGGIRVGIATYPVTEWISSTPPDVARVERDLESAMG